MAANLSYPGVYVQEVSSGVRTIVGVATSIAAFVGRAMRGPVDTPVVIHSYADFERRFGGLWEGSTLGFAVRDFYLNGGSDAVIVRLFGNGAVNDAHAIAGASALAATTAGATAQLVLDAAAKDVASPTRVDDTLKALLTAVDAAAKKAGATPTDVVQAIVIAAPAIPDTAATTDALKTIGDTLVGAAKAAAAQSQAKAKDAADAVHKVAAQIKIPAAPARTLLDAAEAAAKSAGAKPDDVAKAITGAMAAALKTAPNGKAVLDAHGLKLEAAYAGAWGNALRARIEIPASITGPVFNLLVRDTDSGATERFLNVSIVPGPRQVTNVLVNESRLVRALDLPAGPVKHDDPATGQDVWKIDNLSSKVDVPVDDGVALIMNDFAGPGTDASNRGLYGLRKTDLFNLLCIPPYRDDGNVDVDLLTAARRFCVERRALLIVDPPAEWLDKDAAVQAITMFQGDANNTNAALYFPRLTQSNPLHDNQLEDFAPCGVVAGVIARTDTTRGVWKAPAGLDAMLGNVPKLTVDLTNGEIGELNPLGINCLRTAPAAGRVVWGARTLAGNDQLASEWKYLPVRRTALFIEESLYRATQWIVFEPNDEPLWSQIRLNVGAFMHDLFRKGAFQGTTPKDAYFVRCDKDTTTQSDINLGIVNIVVGFAPLKPAEFVVITLQQIAGQIDV